MIRSTATARGKKTRASARKPARAHAKPSATLARKTPVQQRSSERLSRILDAAARVFDERGYAGATTEAIAERAGISIGSLYQYFPGKPALFQALADQLIGQSRGLFDSVIGPELAALPLEDLVGAVVDTYAALHQSLPGFRALMLAGPLSHEIVATGMELFAEFERRISALLLLRNPALEEMQREKIAAVAVHVFHILSSLALRGDEAFGPHGERITAEMKLILVNYLREYEAPAKQRGSLRRTL